MLGGCTDSFGLVRGVRVGVSVQGGDELRHLLVAADAAERALGVEWRSEYYHGGDRLPRPGQ